MSFLLRANETIHFIQGPCSIHHLRWGGVGNRLERPEGSACFHIQSFGGFLHGTIAGVWGAQSHPLGEQINFSLGEFPFGWHFQIRIAITDGLDEQAFLRLPRENAGAAVPSQMPSLADVQPQPPFDLLIGCVAFVASIDQDGPNVGFKKSDLFGRVAQSKGAGQEPCAQDHALHPG